MDRRRDVQRWLALRERESLTFRELSRRSGIPANTLTHWAWRLRKEAVSAGARPRFVELAPLPPSSAPLPDRIEIVMRNKRRAIVPATIDAESLQRIVTALERC